MAPSGVNGQVGPVSESCAEVVMLESTRSKYAVMKSLVERVHDSCEKTPSKRHRMMDLHMMGVHI